MTYLLAGALKCVGCFPQQERYGGERLTVLSRTRVLSWPSTERCHCGIRVNGNGVKAVLWTAGGELCGL